MDSWYGMEGLAGGLWSFECIDYFVLDDNNVYMTSVYCAAEGTCGEFSNSLLLLRGTCVLDPRLLLEDGAHSYLQTEKVQAGPTLRSWVVS